MFLTISWRWVMNVVSRHERDEDQRDDHGRGGVARLVGIREACRRAARRRSSPGGPARPGPRTAATGTRLAGVSVAMPWSTREQGEEDGHLQQDRQARGRAGWCPSPCRASSSLRTASAGRPAYFFWISFICGCSSCRFRCALICLTNSGISRIRMTTTRPTIDSAQAAPLSVAEDRRRRGRGTAPGPRRPRCAASRAGTLATSLPRSGDARCAAGMPSRGRRPAGRPAASGRAGTGSKPPRLQGLQRIRRHPASSAPLSAPWVSIEPTAYAEQLG